ncbi:MAG: D-alanine--D-alanine ligase family protein, partial [Anaerolineales bacterium]
FLKFRPDFVFIALHGGIGENGGIQGFLETLKIPYSGSGILSSALCLNKILCKEILIFNKIPTPPFIILEKNKEIKIPFKFPVVVKPANLGSSVGISKCNSHSDLAEGLIDAARYDRRILIERGVGNLREVEVSVLGNENPIASVCGEVLPSREFYSYESKYVDGTSGLIIPSQLPNEITEKIREYAIRAYKAIDCAGMARADFFVEVDTEKIYINELNTLPGFTSISMYPKLWQASGLTYAQLVDKLIELALERKLQRDRTERRRTA